LDFFNLIFEQLVSPGKLVCHRAKFHQNWPNGFGDIAIFRFLRWPPVAIMDIQIFKHLVTRRVGTANSLCIVVPNFIKIGHGC